MNNYTKTTVDDLLIYERALRDGLNNYRLDLLEYTEVLKTLISLQSLIQELSHENKC